MKDNINREINYLRISITDRCNLRCKYCMPTEGIEKKYHDEILSFEEIVEVVKVAVSLGITKIRITGGEPLVRKGVVGLISNISAVDGVEEIAMTTNGVLLKDHAKELKDAGLDRVNISLDSLNKEKYKEITQGGRIEDVIAGIDAAQEVGLEPIKVNVVIMKDFNVDEIMDFSKLTIKRNIEIRFIELMPFGTIGENNRDNYISNEDVKKKFSSLERLESTDSVAEYYKLPDSLGKIGFINPISNSFCSKCNKIRLTSDGKLKTCLHSNDEIDIKDALLKKDCDQLKGIILNAINEKPKEHSINHHEPIERNMYKIGG